MKNEAYISLGANMGDRVQTLLEAIKLLNEHEKIRLVNNSSVYETDPVGYEDQDLFLNMVIQVLTDLSAEELLEVCLEIELQLGRKRLVRWGPRTIDLDILLYNQENIETEKLFVPHPRMLERGFVLIPLLEMNQDIQIPNLDKPVQFYLDHIHDKEGVRIWKRKNGEDVFALIES
ncbi:MULTISPECIES: 2-amino-4-hydroxy-6-hydroxymethyldihydropteridine diphosphokinase [unclassified Bacillus (in: firmicutes)]|uniref:2-amino-4-hydroxy-6- hydroxymethyldihydropteridine diphosphokinase n=1 Tax=unclassified Bacillus (in: firmicutes) TaxID=185979 RepID=UPI0008F0A694|nr:MULTISPECIES: 2-amino-4-hydroxy-6-hydroxymethyldihydropteridine diphosphokinase [unclassified Bacillus (in: firmicutes)]SFB23039.1 2-amino-4-hydroxy-6-hydroxymethyldihydropteridinediphosphokinase [Bacillus sp. UNCCL13]SFQ91128.1 2-amino-4-hydroxy-6-hydroxymethyldihydropteridinediphosphokinase [Bacillus sp. cl95]